MFPLVCFDPGISRPDDATITAVSEGIRGYALDPEIAEALLKKSEELVGESFSVEFYSWRNAVIGSTRAALAAGA